MRSHTPKLCDARSPQAASELPWGDTSRCMQPWTMPCLSPPLQLRPLKLRLPQLPFQLRQPRPILLALLLCLCQLPLALLQRRRLLRRARLRL